MKQKLSIKFILILFVGIIITSCEYDIDDNSENHQHHKKNEFKMSKITLDDVKQNPEALSKLTNTKKVKSLSKINHKIINDTINNFSIDTEIGTFIESDNYHSYTFKVFRPNGSIYLLENLVVSKQGTNDYETYLYQYDITEQETQMLKEGLQLDLTNKMNILTIENTNILTIENTNIITDIHAKEFPCFVQVTSYVEGNVCPNGHSWGQVCIYYGESNGPTAGYYITESILSVCNDSSGSGGNTNTNTNNSPNSSQTTGGGGPGITVTTPTIVPCRTCPELYDEETPCGQLNKSSKDSVFLSKLNYLKVNVNLNYEVGFVQVPTDTLATSYNYTPVQGTSNSNEIEFSLSAGLISGFFHTHYSIKKQFSIFSLSDIYSIYDLAINNNIYDDSFTAILVTAHGTKYAIKFDNPQSLVNFGNFWFVDWDLDLSSIPEGTYESKRKKIEKIYNQGIKKSNSNSKNEMNFVKFIEKYNLGISIYKSNENFTEWEKINNDGTTTPCN